MEFDSFKFIPAPEPTTVEISCSQVEKGDCGTKLQSESSIYKEMRPNIVTQVSLLGSIQLRSRLELHFFPAELICFNRVSDDVASLGILLVFFSYFWIRSMN